MVVQALGEVVRAPSILSCGRMLAWVSSRSMIPVAGIVDAHVTCQVPLPVVHTGQLSLICIGKLFSLPLGC